MIMAGALERASGAAGPRFIVKGGVALELRLRDRARAKPIAMALSMGSAMPLINSVVDAVSGVCVFAGRNLAHRVPMSNVDARA